jgi:hypothetical protein
VTAQAAQPPARPLPIRPRPVSGETTFSYIRRLAVANHMRPLHLRRYLKDPGGGFRLGWLAALAGRPHRAGPRRRDTNGAGEIGDIAVPGRRPAATPRRCEPWVSLLRRSTQAHSATGSNSAMVPKVANIENGEISLAPKLGDTWCRNSR